MYYFLKTQQDEDHQEASVIRTNKKTPAIASVDGSGCSLITSLAPPVGLSQIPRTLGNSDEDYRGGNEIVQIADWIRDNLSPEQVDRLVNNLLAGSAESNRKHGI